ncbi:MAG TPA: beta-galactosidase [Bryobacteraceae bacterium]|nr:beta-galactosidase [Bryobacteraceae bacterium]
MTRVRLVLFLICGLAPAALQAQPVQAEDFFPMSVWYGGGKARAPMLERDPRSKVDTWRKDLTQLKALGFNTVRCWIDWATGEPEEGQYRFDTIDVILKLAEEQGLKVVIQVYMDSAPAWVGKKFPDSLFVSSNGMVIHPESSPGYCRDHAGVRDVELKFYTALARRAQKSLNFLGWDLWSEPHVINWATPTYIERPEFCFCRHSVARFRRWLQKKYGSLEALNDSWYRHFSSWDEVEPNRLSTILSYTDFIDWKQFIADKLGEDLRDRYEAVKLVDPHTVATSHAAGIGLFSSPLWWEGQSDDWTMSSQVDYYGTSLYPKHSSFVNRDVEWRGALLDFTRSFGFAEGGRGFWIGELQGGFGTVALNVSPAVTPEDIRIWTWSALSRGAKAINYYAWYPMSTGYESGGFGLIKLDGTITERSRVAGSIAQVVNRNQKLFLAARPPKAEVAIVYNPLTYFVGGREREAAYGGPQGEVEGIERDSMLGIYRALFPTNVALDFIHINRLSEDLLKQYKLVLLPYPLMIPAASAAEMKNYVSNGGTLVAEARLGWNNEHGSSSPVIPGMGLHEVMGCRETDVQTGKAGRTTVKWTSSEIPGFAAGESLQARWYEETLEPLGPGAHVAATFPGGAAAAVISTYGKGKTLMLGSYVGAAYETHREPAAAQFYAALLAWAGVRLPVTVVGGTAEVRYLQSGADTLVFVFNHGKQSIEPSVSLSVRAGKYRGTDIVTGKTVEISEDAGRVAFHGQIAPEDVWVVDLSPR